MWTFSWAPILAASPSLAVVLRSTPAQVFSTSRSFLQGRSMNISYVPTVNASGTLQINPISAVTTIKLNGREFRVLIDTGSDDLVMVTPSDFNYDTNGSVPVSSSYSSANITGTTGFAEMQLGDYTFSKQAFMDITAIEGKLGIGTFGIDGLMGLGLDPLGPKYKLSPLSTALQTQGDTVGQPFLFNIFDAHATETNFIAISLSRTDDLEGSAEASFTIMELDETYAVVKETTPVPLFPANSPAWSILVDAITVDGVNVPLVSTVPNAPNGKFVAAIDSGTTLATLPPDILYALYSQIPGATITIDDDQIKFVIPCNTTSVVTVVIGGRPFPIHPLDLSELDEIDDRNATGVFGSICVGLIQAAEPNENLDALFGDIFMRNFYSVFNFGNVQATSPDDSASMHFLSLTDPHAAAADVLNVRMAQLANKTPEFQGLLPDFQHALPGSTSPKFSHTNSGAHLASDAAIADVSGTDGETEANNDSTVHKYALIIIGMVGANILVVLILAFIGVALYIKRGGMSGTSTSRYTPVRFREEDPRKSGAYDESRRYAD